MLIQLRAASPYSVKEYDRKLMGFCGFAEDFTDFSDFFTLWKEIRTLRLHPNQWVLSHSSCADKRTLFLKALACD